MKALSRAGSSRWVIVSVRDFIFLKGMVIMGVSPIGVCLEMGKSGDVASDEVFRRVYPVFRRGLNT